MTLEEAKKRKTERESVKYYYQLNPDTNKAIQIENVGYCKCGREIKVHFIGNKMSYCACGKRWKFFAGEFYLIKNILP